MNDHELRHFIRRIDAARSPDDLLDVSLEIARWPNGAAKQALQETIRRLMGEPG